MTRDHVPTVVRVLAIPVVAIVVLVGLWIAGGRITNDFDAAMWISLGWMVLAGLICLAVGIFFRPLRRPVIGTFVVIAAVLGIYLLRSIVFDDEVEENVVRATTPGAALGGAAGGMSNALIRLGQFQPVRHPAEGRVEVIDLAKGGHVLTLTDFNIDNGPDLRVYLVNGPARTESEVKDYRSLGSLHGSKGPQQYEIPDSVDLKRYSTVVIWCRAFSVLFARAPTRPA